MDNEVLYKPHEGPQMEFHKRTEDVVLFGGSKGGGKSEGLLFDATAQIGRSGYKAIIFRRTYKRLTDLVDRAKLAFPKLGAKWEGEEKRFRFPSGATIAFSHCEHEDDKYNHQGQEYAFIGFDQLEEFTESQFNFLCLQNRTSDPEVKCYVRATANPGGVGHFWVKRRFIDRARPREVVTDIYPIPNRSPIKRTSVFIPSTIYDNPTLLKSSPQYLATLQSGTEEEKRAYLEGDWEVFSSQTVFDNEGMKIQELKVEDPEFVGCLVDAESSPKFINDDKERLEIFRHPEDQKEYFISADVAEGLDGGDYSCAFVFDKSKKEVVARWWGKCEPIEFGKILYGIGAFYKFCKIAVEVWPGPGRSTVEKLIDMGYPNLFKSFDWDGEKHTESAAYGWRTTPSTRPDMINTIRDVIRRKSGIVRSREALNEMYNFIRNEKTGKLEAREGAHDDNVIALAIGFHCMRFDPVGDILGEHDSGPFMVTSLVKQRKPGKFRRER